MSNLPTEPGLYLCAFTRKTESGANVLPGEREVPLQYDAIVTIKGVAPFMSASYRCFGDRVRGSGCLLTLENSENFLFGPKIDISVTTQ